MLSQSKMSFAENLSRFYFSYPVTITLELNSIEYVLKYCYLQRIHFGIDKRDIFVNETVSMDNWRIVFGSLY